MDEFDDSPLYEPHARAIVWPSGTCTTATPAWCTAFCSRGFRQRGRRPGPGCISAALPRLHTLRELNRFGAWLAAIARNCANDYHRRGVAEVELDDEVEEKGQPGHGPRAA